MAYNQLITKSGHSLFTMSSLYQKAIRRCDVRAAGYAANELFDKYEHYLWKSPRSRAARSHGLMSAWFIRISTAA